MHTLAPCVKAIPFRPVKKNDPLKGDGRRSGDDVPRKGCRGVRRLFDIIILAARTRLPGISRKNGSLYGLTAIPFHTFFPCFMATTFSSVVIIFWEKEENTCTFELLDA